MQTRLSSAVFKEERVKRAKLYKTREKWWSKSKSLMDLHEERDGDDLIGTLSLPFVISNQLQLPDLPSMIISQFLIGVRSLKCKHSADDSTKFSTEFNCNCESHQINQHLTSLAGWRCTSREGFVSAEVEMMHNTFCNFRCGLKYQSSSLWFLAQKGFSDCANCMRLITWSGGRHCDSCPSDSKKKPLRIKNSYGISKSSNLANLEASVYCGEGCIYRCGWCEKDMCKKHPELFLLWRNEICQRCDGVAHICDRCCRIDEDYDSDFSGDAREYRCRDCSDAVRSVPSKGLECFHSLHNIT